MESSYHLYRITYYMWSKIDIQYVYYKKVSTEQSLAFFINSYSAYNSLLAKSK